MTSSKSSKRQRVSDGVETAAMAKKMRMNGGGDDDVQAHTGERRGFVGKICVWKMCVCILIIVLTKCEGVSARRAPRVFVPPEHLPKEYCATLFSTAVSEKCCAALSGVVYSPLTATRDATTPLDKMLPRKDRVRASGEGTSAQKFQLEGLTSSLGGGFLSTHFISELSYATGSRLPFDIGHFNHCRNIQGSRFMLVTLLTDQRGMAERIIEVYIHVHTHTHTQTDTAEKHAAR